MDHKEAGQGTPFDSMSHETMLAWLDKANSGAIQGASDRLVSAATEIRKIAEDLKVRPQMVEWKGEGADAFRTWSADLANATLRLGDYSEGASKWLAQASDALASAQVAIPRTDASAEANLEAAQAARNDPDASAVQKKSLETLLAAKESNRQEAAAQMRRLAQSYSFSASQMDGLEKPVFPPPPGAIVPEREEQARNVSVGRDFGSSSSGVASVHASTSSPGGSEAPVSVGTSSRGPSDQLTTSGPSPVRPVDMEIAGTATLPDAPAVTPITPTVGPGGGKTDGITPITAPIAGSGPMLPPTTSGGRPVGAVRPPMPTVGNPGSSPLGRPARDGSIVGGRPVAQSTGRPPGGLPRGNVIGSEGSHAGRAPMAHGGGIGGPGSQSGIVGGRRLAGETGGMVGGRPQQPGRAVGRPFTPGGTGLVRGAAGEGGRGAGAVGRGAGVSPQRAGDPRREDGERPDYLVEDEETWQLGGRRVVPPVVD